MLTFPFKDSLFIVIDPGNVRYMKELKPLEIQVPHGCKSIGIVITPNQLALERKLKMPMPIDALVAALEECKTLPDAEQLTVVDGVNRNA